MAQLNLKTKIAGIGLIAMIASGCSTSTINNRDYTPDKTLVNSEIVDKPEKTLEDYGFRRLSLFKDGLGKYFLYSFCGMNYVPINDE